MYLCVTGIKVCFFLRFFFWILEQEFNDTKGVIRIRNSKKDRQHSGQKKTDKQQYTKHYKKAKDRATRTQLKSGVKSCDPEV